MNEDDTFRILKRYTIRDTISLYNEWVCASTDDPRTLKEVLAQCGWTEKEYYSTVGKFCQKTSK